jgi:hypothetical protein
MVGERPGLTQTRPGPHGIAASLSRVAARAAVVAGALGLVVAVSLLGCPGAIDDLERFRPPACGAAGQPACTTTTSTRPTSAPTTAEVLQQVFNECIGCHSTQAPQGQFVMAFATPAAFESAMLAGTSSTTFCNGRKFVVAGEPEQSLLYLKLTAQFGCGSRMPLGVPLSTAKTDLVKRWIEGLE